MSAVSALLEHHKQRRADFDHNIEIEEVSDQYGWTEIDPWVTELVYKYEIGDGFSYVDRASHYRLHSYNKRDSAIARKREEIEKDSPTKEVKPGQGRRWRQNHRFNNHEILQ
jgi:hypothetical protein